TNVSQNQVDCMSTVNVGSGIGFNGGSLNIAWGNTINGHRTPGVQNLGCDDGITVQDERYDNITNNTITSCYDAGIETYGQINDSNFAHNTISDIPFVGIGSWYATSIAHTAFSGNTVDRAGHLFRFLANALEPGATTYYFTGN